MNELIRRAAKDAGFFAVGIARAEPVPEKARLDDWLSRDLCAAMDWMRRGPAERCDPQSLLDGARSVVCCALAYRFAAGRDYHDIVREKLRRVADAAKSGEPGARFKLCVDTSPILEKPFAVRAGIGWQGKNSVVINPNIGSFFVLGEIITDLELEPDGPVPDKCGDCRKCIDACPTGAIVSPKVIDVRRCLSYLTIEHKGPIDDKFAKIIKKGQYGCDICQNACPFNKGENYDTAR